MEQDTEDVRKIDEIISRHKTEVQEQDQEDDVYECGDFINLEELSEPEEIEDEYVLPDFQATDISKFQTYDPSQLLKDEEKQIVDGCNDPELKSLLQLNRAKNIQLMQFYKKIKDLLVECQENITAKNEQIDSMKSQKRTFFRVWRLGYPYFKTPDNFPCPRNADAEEKDRNQELLFYQMTPSKRWNQVDMNRLMKGVVFCYKMGKELELKKRISKLEAEITRSGCKDKLETLKELNVRLTELTNSEPQETPPVGSDKFVDWDRVSTHFLRGKYTYSECKTMWHLYLDPHINKAPWTKEEETKLIELSDTYKQQNWDQIVADLGTQRSGLLACTHYHSNLLKPGKKETFTPEEDEFLIKMVEKYKQNCGSIIPWSKIAHHFVGKSRHNLFYRYHYILCLRNKVSGSERRFSEAEDVLLMILVDKMGRKFKLCEKYFPDRSAVQLKVRYSSHLRRPVKKGAFSVQEDEMILNHVKEYGDKNWAPLLKKMSRYGAQIRQRYKTLNQFMLSNADNDNATAENAPRKKEAVEAKSDLKYEFLRTMADRFKNFDTPTLQDIEAIIREEGREDVVEIEQSSAKIENLLIEHFTENIAKERDQIPEKDYQHYAKLLQDLLNMLQSTLNLPRDYSENPNLDQIDRKILQTLSEKALRVKDKYVMPHKVTPDQELVPPNLETLTAFQSMTPAGCFDVYSTIESLQQFKEENSKVEWCMENYLTSLDQSSQTEVENERYEFYKRFMSLFRYPASMGIIEPKKELNPAPVNASEVTKVTKTYSREKNHDHSNNAPKSLKETDPTTQPTTAASSQMKYSRKKTVVMTEKPKRVDKQHVILSIKKEKIDDEKSKPTEKLPDNIEVKGWQRNMVWIKTEPTDHDFGDLPDSNQQLTQPYIHQKPKVTVPETNIPSIQQKHLEAPSTSRQQDGLTMIERLKLKIQNELLDLDKKEKSKLTIDHMWTKPQENPKSSVSLASENHNTYKNKHKRTIPNLTPINNNKEPTPFNFYSRNTEKCSTGDLEADKLPYFARGAALKRTFAKLKHPVTDNENNPVIDISEVDVLNKVTPSKRRKTKETKQGGITPNLSMIDNENTPVADVSKVEILNNVSLSNKQKTEEIKEKRVASKLPGTDNEHTPVLNKVWPTKKRKPEEIKVGVNKDRTKVMNNEVLELISNNPALRIIVKTNPKSTKTQEIRETNSDNEQDNLSLLERLKRKEIVKKTKPKIEHVSTTNIKKEIMEEEEQNVGHSTFNFQKGELVVESDSDSDLEDLKTLDKVLKKLKKEVHDEGYNM